MAGQPLKRHYGGWNPQRADNRDREFLPTVGRLDVMQTEFALDLGGIPVLDQLNQRACIGHGVAGVTMFDQKQQGQPIIVPSRAMLYFDARIPEGTTDHDAGASVRDGVAGLKKYGACPDAEFPYNDQVCNLAPSPQCYQDAKQQEAIVYEAVQYPHINQAIASGFPVVFGFTVYESFESAQVANTGIVPIPEPGEKVLGGHCVYGFGFNSRYSPPYAMIPPRTKRCRNSWGPNWGFSGDFFLPQWFFDTGQASDFWAIRTIGAGS